MVSDTYTMFYMAGYWIRVAPGIDPSYFHAVAHNFDVTDQDSSLVVVDPSQKPFFAREAKIIFVSTSRYRGQRLAQGYLRRFLRHIAASQMAATKAAAA